MSNYAARIFRVKHGVNFYPLEVITEIDGPNFRAATQDDFLRALGEVFGVGAAEEDDPLADRAVARHEPVELSNPFAPSHATPAHPRVPRRRTRRRSEPHPIRLSGCTPRLSSSRSRAASTAATEPATPGAHRHRTPRSIHAVPHREGYTLTLDRDGIASSRTTTAGMFYARQTLEQIHRQSPDDRCRACASTTAPTSRTAA